MILGDPVQVPNISAKVTLLSKVVWPALATLVPAASTAAFKWTQDHTTKQRSAQLTERISILAKQIAELPVLPQSGSGASVTAQAALSCELESAIHELTAIQAKVTIRRRLGLTTTAAKIRAALLLYRPTGMAAWTLHIAFYVYSVLLILALIAIMTDQSTPFISSVSDAFAFIFLFAVFGTPPLILRYYAAKIHARQFAQVQAQTTATTHGHIATAVPTSGQVI